MTKHTHKGTCQICGSTQAVSTTSGLIAKHGYTTRWGFFSGTCRGSNNLPLQISCDMVQASADSAKSYGIKLTEKAAALNEQTGTEGFYSLYMPATWQNRNSKSVWIRVTFVDTEIENRTIITMVPNMEDVKTHKAEDNRRIREMPTTPAHRFGFYGCDNTTEGYAKHGRTSRAEAYCREASQYFEYYVHQIEVVKNWAPSELIAVK